MTAARDPYSSTLPKPSLHPAARTATATGTAVDRAGAGKMFQNAVVLISTGVITDGSHVITVEDSDDNSAWATVAAANLQSTPPTLIATAAAFDNQIFPLGYLGNKRYLRVKTTASGTTTGGVYSAAVLLADPRVLPAE